MSTAAMIVIVCGGIAVILLCIGLYIRTGSQIKRRQAEFDAKTAQFLSEFNLRAMEINRILEESKRQIMASSEAMRRIQNDPKQYGRSEK